MDDLGGVVYWSADHLARLQAGKDGAFWKRFTCTDSGCWAFTGSPNGKGYGVIRHKGKLVLSHRLAWRKFFRKPIRKGKLILHDNMCNTRACGCPGHLNPGTPSRNMLDRWARKRATTLTNSEEGDSR